MEKILEFLPAAKRQVNIWRRSKKKVTLAFLLPFWPLCLEYFQLVPLCGCLWTCLDPSNHSRVIWTLGPNFCSKGPLAPNSKICNFSHKTPQYGIYRLTWTPVFIFGVIWTLWPNFGSKGPLPSFGISFVQFFDLNCRSTSHLPLTWATTKLVTIMSS